MSLRSRIMLAVALMSCIVVIVLVVSVYAVVTLSEFARDGDPPHVIETFSSRAVWSILAVGIAGLALSFIIAALTAHSLYLRVKDAVGNMIEVAAMLEDARNDPGDNFNELVSIQIQELGWVTRDLVTLLVGKPTSIGRNSPVEPHSGGPAGTFVDDDFAPRGGGEDDF